MTSCSKRRYALLIHTSGHLHPGPFLYNFGLEKPEVYGYEPQFEGRPPSHIALSVLIIHSLFTLI